MTAPLVMLHLGLGFFHRAHQAVYLHRLSEAGDRAGRSPAATSAPTWPTRWRRWRAQGGAYTLETVTPAGERRYERITSIRDGGARTTRRWRG